MSKRLLILISMTFWGLACTPTRSQNANLSESGYALASTEREAKLPNIFKSCALESHRPIYKLKRDPICGIESTRTLRAESCGVESYKSCRSEKNEVERYEKVGPVVELAPNDSITYLFWKDLSEGDCDKVYPKKHMRYIDAHLKSGASWISDFHDKDVIEIISRKTVHGTGTFPAPGTCGIVCPTTQRPGFYCKLEVVKLKPIYKDAPNEECGIEKFKACDFHTYKECRLGTFGIEAYEEAIDPACGVDQKLVENLDDAEYFQSVSGALRSLISQHGKLYEWENVRLLLDENNLMGRTVGFQAMADLKMIINSLELRNLPNKEQKDFNRFFLLMTLDFYVRMIANYNHQKVKDVMSLDALASDIKLKKVELKKSLASAKERINRLGLTPRMTEAIVSNLDKTENQNIEQLVAILSDLNQMIRKGIAANISETENVVGILSEIEPVLKSSYIELYLLKSDYNQAQMKYLDAQSTLRSESNLTLPVTGEWFFDYLKSNAKIRANLELEGANKFFDLVNSTGSVPSSILNSDGKEIPIPAQVMDLLLELQVQSGQSLSGAKLQLLDLVERNLINPLKAFVEKMGI